MEQLLPPPGLTKTISVIRADPMRFLKGSVGGGRQAATLLLSDIFGGELFNGPDANLVR